VAAPALTAPAAVGLTIPVQGRPAMSGLFLRPAGARACYVMAHGAGAGMRHAFMEAMAAELATRRIATLRYQFPFMEQGGKRPDPPHVAHAAVRAAVAEARRLAPDLPLVAGGKSFGGRMTSQAQAEEPLPEVRGLVFVGFPLHPANRPSRTRAEHLAGVQVPMLFLQGTRDALAAVELVRATADDLGSRATLHLVPDADHAFHVPVRSGRKDLDVRSEMADALSSWLDEVALLG
jgi:predicted alpha/beta-hydrolase family hydrolase